MFNKQKQHFKAKLVGVQRMIWDLEFKRFKTREIREEIRQLYDNKKATLSVIEERLKSDEKDEDAPKWKDEVEKLNVELKRYEDQMKGLDLEVDGSVKTNELPDGYEGISQTLESLRELQQMIKNYINEL